MPKSKSRRRPPARRPPTRRTLPPVVVPPPVAPGLRGAVERRSSPVLVWLSAKPKLLPPLFCLTLLVGGATAPRAVAVPLLVVLLLTVGWLTYLSWPAVTRGGRAVRVVTLVLIALATAGRLAD